MCLVSPEGLLVCTYAKHFLYETDKSWADEGPEFVEPIDIPRLGGKVGIGICMDINPYEYVDSSLKEFANFYAKHQAQLIIFLANWLNDNTEPDQPDAISTHNYWAHRLSPLVGTNCKFVACNRIGTEKGSTFCGGSCVISLKKPSLVASLPKRTEAVLFAEI